MPWPAPERTWARGPRHGAPGSQGTWIPGGPTMWSLPADGLMRVSQEPRGPEVNGGSQKIASAGTGQKGFKNKDGLQSGTRPVPGRGTLMPWPATRSPGRLRALPAPGHGGGGGRGEQEAPASAVPAGAPTPWMPFSHRGWQEAPPSASAPPPAFLARPGAPGQA